jgi:hypothetical protein
MPPQTNPRLTKIQHKHILAYRKQGLSLLAIASKVGVAFHQVRDYVWKHPDVPVVRIKPGLEVPIIPGQSRLIQRYQQSTLTAEQIAKRLGVALWDIQEGLGGRKAMSTQQIGAIKRLLAEVESNGQQAD